MSQRTVHLAVRDGPHYRREAFEQGLKRLGYKLTPAVASADLLVIWNRSGNWHNIAKRYEAEGRPVIVAENGYFGHEINGRRYYALALDFHNGAGRWHVGDAQRFETLGIDVKPWRIRDDGELVALAQRGIGSPGIAMPVGWPARVKHLARVRHHPGRDGAGVPLDVDLNRARAVLTWGSGAAIKALAWGIPVYTMFSDWIAAPAARLLRSIDDALPVPWRSDEARADTFTRIAWAQAPLDEIESGEAFGRLLVLHRGQGGR